MWSLSLSSNTEICSHCYREVILKSVVIAIGEFIRICSLWQRWVTFIFFIFFKVYWTAEQYTFTHSHYTNFILKSVIISLSGSLTNMSSMCAREVSLKYVLFPFWWTAPLSVWAMDHTVTLAVWVVYGIEKTQWWITQQYSENRKWIWMVIVEMQMLRCLYWVIFVSVSSLLFLLVSSGVVENFNLHARAYSWLYHSVYST